jgi:hypothetical protein
VLYIIYVLKKSSMDDWKRIQTKANEKKFKKAFAALLRSRGNNLNMIDAKDVQGLRNMFKINANDYATIEM